MASFNLPYEVERSK